MKKYISLLCIIPVIQIVQAAGPASQTAGRIASRYASTLSEQINMGSIIRMSIEKLENTLAQNMAQLRKLGSDFSAQSLLEREEIAQKNKVLHRELQKAEAQLAQLEAKILTKNEEKYAQDQATRNLQVQKVQNNIKKEELENAHKRFLASQEERDALKAMETQEFILEQRAAKNKKEAYTGNIPSGKVASILGSIAAYFGYKNNEHELDNKVSTLLQTVQEKYDKDASITLFESLSSEEQLKALRQAIIDNNLSMVELLLEIGVDPTPVVDLAVKKNNAQVTQLLLDAGAQLPDIKEVVVTPVEKEKSWLAGWYNYFFQKPQPQPSVKKISITEKMILKTPESVARQEEKGRIRTSRLADRFEEKRYAQEIEDSFQASLEPQAHEFSFIQAFQKEYPDKRTDFEVLQDLATIENAVDFNFAMNY